MKWYPRIKITITNVWVLFYVGLSLSIFSIHITLTQSLITWCLVFQFSSNFTPMFQQVLHQLTFRVKALNDKLCHFNLCLTKHNFISITFYRITYLSHRLHHSPFLTESSLFKIMFANLWSMGIYKTMKYCIGYTPVPGTHVILVVLYFCSLLYYEWNLWHSLYIITTI